MVEDWGGEEDEVGDKQDKCRNRCAVRSNWSKSLCTEAMPPVLPSTATFNCYLPVITSSASVTFSDHVWTVLTVLSIDCTSTLCHIAERCEDHTHRTETYCHHTAGSNHQSCKGFHLFTIMWNQTSGMSDLVSNWARLSPNRTIMELLKIRFMFILARWAQICPKTNFRANLPSLPKMFPIGR